MKDNKMLRGALLTILSGVLCGFSGTCGQFLLQSKGWTSNFLVPLRMTSAGAVLLALCMLRQGRQTFDVMKKDARSLEIFGIVGMSLCQYTYFTGIGVSNAGTTTVLQYTAPVMILAWTSLCARRLPRRIEVAAIVLALTGTFLLATHGRPGSMVLSGKALFWGLLSAVALAVYTVYPVRLLHSYGSMAVTAWGMLVGGGALMLLFKPWSIRVTVDGEALLAMSAVVLLGTVTAFTAYMEGVRCVGPKKGSLYSSIEPVAAAVFSAALMGAQFVAMDVLGFVCILSTIFLLAMDRQE